MVVVTPSEMQKIDKTAIDDFGIPGIVLMENAAMQVVGVIEERYFSQKEDGIVILAGGGNNGGDGLAIARHLFLKGANVEVILLSEPDKIKGDARVNLEIAKKLRIPLRFVYGEDSIPWAKKQLNSAHLIVDAIFGTGLSRPVESIFAEIIVQVNSSGIPVLAVDIPSGINGENGHIMGVAIKAKDTVTFGYPKRGHLLYPGKRYTGKLHVVPIGLPPSSAESVGVMGFTVDEVEAAGYLRERSIEGHKGTFGKVAVVAGSTGMTGAAYLTSMAALRSGTGLVTLGIPASLNCILENKLTEVMTMPLKDHGTGCLHEDSLENILMLLRNKDVLALGPGLGKSNEIYGVLRNILGKIDISIVLDADGLNHISGNIDLLREHSKPVVITPHPGEMARLTGITIKNIIDYPVDVAQKLSQQLKIVVLLKGAATVVCDPHGRVYFNGSGNCGMATAGSGDVLTGIIAGFIAQGYDAYHAAVLGAFIHGCAGDLAASLKGEAGMTAGDILEAIPPVLVEMYDLSQKAL